jgi:hypothetical protein
VRLAPDSEHLRCSEAGGINHIQLVQGDQPCHNCLMLRRFVATGQTSVCLRLAAAGLFWIGLFSNVVGCGSAPPVDIGTDYAIPVPAENGEDELEPLPTVTDPDLDIFVNRDPSRGVVSEYCRSSFQACGGVLAGTWVVEDTCNPRSNEPTLLQRWGVAQMDLDTASCTNAVRMLTSSWSGKLVFVEGRAFDDRERAQKVDIELTPNCIGATLGMDPESASEPAICTSMQNDESMVCGSSEGNCICSSQTVIPGDVTGVYGVLGTTVAVQDNGPLNIYEYCVDGDQLLWREPNTQRHVVLRRTEPGPIGEDPTGMPQ